MIFLFAGKKDILSLVILKITAIRICSRPSFALHFSCLPLLLVSPPFPSLLHLCALLCSVESSLSTFRSRPITRRFSPAQRQLGQWDGSTGRDVSCPLTPPRTENHWCLEVCRRTDRDRHMRRQTGFNG